MDWCRVRSRPTVLSYTTVILKDVSNIIVLDFLMHRLMVFSVQFNRSVMSDSLDPMDCSMPGFFVLYHLLEHSQTHVH